MTKLRHFAGAIPFFVAVFLNAFVDLGHKIIIQNTVFKLYDGPVQVILTAVVNGLILLPFILLLSPAGFLSDKYRKTQVMRFSGWAVVICTALITVFYYLGWFWAAFGMTFLLAAQSAIYSPAKFGYIKECFGKERLSEANGVVSAISIVAILAGIFAYSIAFELLFNAAGAPETKSEVMRVIAPVGFLLIINSVVELIMMYRLPKQPATGVDTAFAWKRLAAGKLFRDDLEPLASSRAVRLSVIGLATFWAVGQVMLAAFPAFYKSVTTGDNTIVVQGILACTGIGIAIGSMVAGKVSKNYIETGLLPIGALGITLGLWWLPHIQTNMGFALDFLFVGFCGGMFIVPLNALVQFNAGEHTLGKTLAANNWVQNVTMLSFLVLTAVFSYFGWRSQTLLQLIAVVALVGCCYVVWQLPQSMVRFALGCVIRRRYRVSVQNMKNMPAQGGVLLLGNHVSWIDWAILQIASPRPMRFVMIRNIYERWYLKWFFDLFGCIPIESGPRSRKALDQVTDALNQGDVVCLFPEGTISRTGHLAEFRKGFERACQHVNDNVVILPFYLRGLWGSQFSRASTHLKQTRGTVLRRDLIVAFGKPLAKNTSADVLKRRVLDLSIDSWQAHTESLPTIAHAWVDSAKSTGKHLCLADFSLKRELSGTKALAASWMFARKIRKLSGAQNVGLLLPTSAPGVLMNMAGLLAGKTLVNLNYTASNEALSDALDQAEIETVFTSEKFLARLSAKGIDLTDVLSSVKVVTLESIAGELSLLEKLSTLLLVTCLPARLLKRWACVKTQPTDVAAILFSSGSEGSPKGVQLTHTNILANVKQVADVLNMEDDDAVMANLPLFHAFGLTVTQFLPLLEGCPMICHADPTDALGGAKAIARYKATVLCGTSTFLRLYCRNNKVHPLMLDSLRVVVAGAEKLNPDVREAFEKKFNRKIYEGYGATETTPVASVNLPDKLEVETFKVQRGQKVGSVGMPLPGSSCMIVSPETYEELPTGEAGMVLIGGAQVMKGYLKNTAKTQSVIHQHDGKRWYITGDKGYIDEDGYLYVVDRYSRFAKIGGEMVSLASVEQAIIQNAKQEGLEVVVVNLPDEKKGERLVVLMNQACDVAALKSQLQGAGLTALAIPADWHQVAVMPKLGSGKTDFAKAKQMALEHSCKSDA